MQASQEEIKQRFRRLALQCHPDKSGSSSGAAEQFHAIREAFQTLSDPVRRFNYDKTLVAQLDMQVPCSGAATVGVVWWWRAAAGEGCQAPVGSME